MSGFNKEGTEKSSRVLYRVESPRGNQGIEILVQSIPKPDWAKIESLEGLLAKPPEVKEFAPQFTKGQNLMFRLLANPTVKREGKRHGYFREEDQEAWFKRKAAESGVTTLRLTVIPPVRREELTR